jgi:CRISPR-associated endonuclease Csn1
MSGELVFGIDLGIGTCGWAVIRQEGESGEIVQLGTRTFDVPETDKERTPTNQLRRQHRGLRTVLRRRRQRMNLVRGIFHDVGLIDSEGKSELRGAGLDPWDLRAAGLDRLLQPSELAIALGHIAKHRGFKSNSKRDRGANAADESSKMLKAIGETADRLARWRTVGEMFARDPCYAGRKHNRDGDYSRSVLRDDLGREVSALFAAQRRLGSKVADQDLETRFVEAAFYQRPLRDSDDKVGACPFEADEKRTARHAPSFERFRLLSRLTSLRIRSGLEERALTPPEIAAATADLGAAKGLSFTRLRRLIELPESARFEGITPEDETKRDVVARGGSATPGTYVLRNALEGAGWESLRPRPDKLDRVAEILTFREDLSSIRAAFEALDLDPLVVGALLTAAEKGAFAIFKGAGHVSAKACRSINPHLAEGLVYSAACAAAGYDHAKRPETRLESIANPIARKALTEALKQVRALIHEYGRPEHIHVELARDVGKSIEERREIEEGIEKRNKDKDRLRAYFLEDLGREPAGREDLLRYELWREQKGKSLYSNDEIPVRLLIASDNSVQVDHILPWSRSGDDSFINKTLCLARENQEKKGRTPYEWFGNDEKRWAAFTARVEGIKGMKGRKKRNYLLKDASILEEKFRSRNLNDTRYATRLLLDVLAREYPADGRRHVLARPGALTDRLRRAWGIHDLKKDETGKRLDDDRHHALDALIVAATSEAALQRLTRAFQESEARGGHRDFSGFPPPWPGFIEENRRKFAEITVSRAERHRARGKGHDATIRQMEDRDGEPVVYERRAIDRLKLQDLALIKDPERNEAIVAALRTWIEAGKPKDSLPLSPKGDVIHKIRLATDKKPAVMVRGGVADRGDMARVDVFRKRSRRNIWEYYLVPIYPHQVFGPEGNDGPPNRAIVAYKPEDEWPLMDVAEGYEFLWSLHQLSWIEVEKADGTFIDGYFRGASRSTGSLSISPHQSNSQKDVLVSIGAKTLKHFQKFVVDRLGRRFKVDREVRTWHGAACT